MATFAGIGDGTRTASAYSRYLARAHVGDLAINPSLVSRDIDRVTRTLPGVTSVTSSVLLDATVDEGTPRTHAVHEADPDPVEVDGSLDGRFTTMDRPALVRGRMPTGPNEALVNVEQAADSGWHLGTVIPLALWSRGDVIDAPDTVPSPCGRARPHRRDREIVRRRYSPTACTRATASSSVRMTARYACLRSRRHRTPRSRRRSRRWRRRTATSYQYYSLKFRDGDQGHHRRVAVFTKESAALTAKLPQALRETGASTRLSGRRPRRRADRVARSNSPLAAAQIILGLAAGAVTIATVGLMAAPEHGRARSSNGVAAPRLDGLATSRRDRLASAGRSCPGRRCRRRRRVARLLLLLSAPSVPSILPRARDLGLGRTRRGRSGRVAWCIDHSAGAVRRTASRSRAIPALVRW